jgi:hypothetical protein
VDRAEAAETVVQIVLDNDCDPEEIRSAFAGDTQIKNALSVYINRDDEEYQEDDEDEDDSEWEN